MSDNAEARPVHSDVMRRDPAEVFPPSDFIREEMEARGWDAGTLTKLTWLKREAIDGMLAGTLRITPVFAFALARAFDTNKELWLNLQSSWDRKGA